MNPSLITSLSLASNITRTCQMSGYPEARVVGRGYYLEVVIQAPWKDRYELSRLLDSRFPEHWLRFTGGYLQEESRKVG